ncbi:hypothetical protein NPIL_577771 [Nephila pilipes]|uniref:Uncharacterized protein n=1 Tax=Nephila pilipes TaxID=299642 RepID=A0A8X6NJU1_NEPPI|nr:hypothetical protein NPIL_577771 [Nephila pilipes]
MNQKEHLHHLEALFVCEKTSDVEFGLVTNVSEQKYLSIRKLHYTFALSGAGFADTHIDYIGPYPPNDGIWNCLTITDRVTKGTESIDSTFPTSPCVCHYVVPTDKLPELTIFFFSQPQYRIFSPTVSDEDCRSSDLLISLP